MVATSKSPRIRPWTSFLSSANVRFAACCRKVGKIKHARLNCLDKKF